MGLPLRVKRSFLDPRFRGEKRFLRQRNSVSQSREYITPQWFEKHRNFTVARVFYGPWAEVEKAGWDKTVKTFQCHVKESRRCQICS